MGAQWVKTAFPTGGFLVGFGFSVPGFVWQAIQRPHTEGLEPED